MKSIITGVMLLLCLCSVSHAATIDTSFRFSTIDTPHFSIHFHQGLEAVARKAAVIAENVHDKLSKEFSWRPSQKTEMVLIDDSDFTNGSATTLPYNTIYVQVVPPSIASTLGEYDDWLKVIITHEYAHIVTLDPARGYWQVMRAIFGKPFPGVDPLSELFFLMTAPPNTFLPRWWLEGIATWAETAYTGVGRGKSSFYDMIFRMAVTDNNFPTISQLNGDAPDWPNGNTPYIFGYKLQQYIADTYGNDALGKLSLAHSGRFPYLISAPPQELFGGKNYRDLYIDMIEAVKREQSQRIAALSQAPFTPLRTISKQGEMLTNPRFSPDGNRIAFLKRDPHDHASTVITDQSGNTIVAQFRRTYSDGSSSWSPDGGRLYFTQSEIQNGFNTYQDLYSYDLSDNVVTRLTNGKRLGDVDLSPDGRRFVAVVSGRGSQNLALLEMPESGKESALRIITDVTLQRVSSPRWSPDGKNISYTVTDNDGMTSLCLYDVTSDTHRTLFTANHAVACPVWSRDGSFLLYMSDETGVFNLFGYDLKEGKSYQASHLLGGALQPDISPDGKAIIFSNYDSHGFSIVQMALDREKWSAERGPSLPVTKKVQAQQLQDKGGNTTVSLPQATVVPYNPLRTLFPTFWLPRISDDGSGTAAFGLFTAGADVLGYNSYTLAADYGSGRNRGYFDLNYQNDYFYPTLFLKAHASPLLYANLEQRGNYYELNQGVTVGASVPLNSLESRYRFFAGYQLQDQKALSRTGNNGNFNGVSVFQGRRDNLFTGISFDNILRYPYSISSEEGRQVSVRYRRFGQELGNDRNLTEYSGEYKEFLRLPSPAQQRQILYLRLAGAISDSSQTYGQQAFQIGGIPSDLNPYPLRGYAERLETGKYIATGTLEYRVPLSFPMRGFGSAAYFMEKVHGALFVDAGEVWDDRTLFSGSNIKVGAGVEARMDITLGYWLKLTPALGVAHGFNKGGEDQVYFTVYIGL